MDFFSKSFSVKHGQTDARLDQNYSSEPHKIGFFHKKYITNTALYQGVRKGRFNKMKVKKHKK